MSSYPYDSERLGSGQQTNPFAYQGSLQEHEPEAGDGSFRLSSYQLEDFKSLGGWMTWFGWSWIIGGVFNCLAVFSVLAGNILGIFNIIPAVMCFFIGFWCTGGGKAFSAVGRGRGNIVPDLMEGVENTRAFFRLHVVLMIIVLIVFLACVALLILLAGAGAMRPPR